jgi:hypothetical protein
MISQTYQSQREIKIPPQVLKNFDIFKAEINKRKGGERKE